MLAGDDVRVLVLMEQRLQGLQLVLGEYGAMPARPALDLVEGLHLTLVLLGIPTDPDCRVEEPHGPGELGTCNRTGAAAALGVGAASPVSLKAVWAQVASTDVVWKEAAGHLLCMGSCLITVPARRRA